MAWRCFSPLVGSLLGVFSLIGLYDVVLRMWGGVAVDPVLASVPMFIFMGTILLWLPHLAGFLD